VNYKAGPIVDDLESCVPDDRFTRQMRNRSDIGNWVHEMTHRVNGYYRGIMKQRTGRHHGSFYVLGGYAVSVPTPNVTLAQVAALVPKDKRGDDYGHYLVMNQRYRQNEPLFVLDEATAYANGLCYQVTAGKPNATRRACAEEWLAYSEALVVAVRKHHARYKQLEDLESFVEWHNARIRFLMKKYDEMVRDLLPPKPRYKLW
jgi:hypothetical protein